MPGFYDIYDSAGGGGGGGGITSINGDTSAGQLLVVGTAGSDFNIADDLVGTHTFNLPTASASVRGALSTANWTTFNNKVTSVSGTTNRITSTGGTTPVIDISAAYVGQASITTLGTISTGVWAGTAVAITKGGTGQTTANDALNALLPSQGGNATKGLITDGTNASWGSVSASVAIGSGIGSGTAKSVLFVGAGALLAQDNTNFAFDYTNIQLKIGSTTVLNGSPTNPLVEGGTSTGYLANYIQNLSNGVQASTDLTGGNDADDGTVLTGHYVDLGINSSTYDGSSGWTINAANDGYCYVNGGHFAIGTGTATKYVKIFTGGITAAKERVRIADTGLGVNTLATPAAWLHVIGTTEQVRIGYDASNYYKTTVSSAGLVTFDAVGASAGFTFADTVTGTLFDATNRTQGLPVNAQTGTTYTFILADAGKMVTANNAAAQTYTVPPNSSVAYPVGTTIDVAGIGAGKVTLAQGAGVTISSKAGNKAIGAQYVGVTLRKIATDTWLLFGDLIA